MATTKKEVIERVNEKIINLLESGVNPWAKPWNYPRVENPNSNYHAMNYVSNQPYTGINAVLLDAGYYVTYKQAQELGGNVKKGAKGEFIVWMSPINVKDKTKKEIDDTTTNEDKMKKIFVLKYYHVFNITDCENIREIKGRFEEPKIREVKTIEEIDNIIETYSKRENVKIEYKSQDRAFYSPMFDRVILPQKYQFKSINEMYSTMFHELGHSTGHDKRLKRGLNKVAAFGSETYSKEELIAEITSAYCLNYTGTETTNTISNSASYLKGWAEHLKGNTLSWFILNATTQAEKAFKMIVDIKD